MYTHFKIICRPFIFFLLVNLFQFSKAYVVSTGDFNKDFYVIWSPDHITTSADGRERSLKLDQQSGVWSGFASNQKFLFGKLDMKIKLVPGNSAGTVVAYYLISSDGPDRDEIDFEFLGKGPGEPYILQTNVFVNGNGNREERIALWFDPTSQFHTYSILWTIHQLVFLADSIPIRVYKNNPGLPFPMSQPLNIKATLWNGESLATRGGHEKINWTEGPFIASFSDYKIDACVSSNPASCRTKSPINWWNYGRFSTLTFAQRRWYKWVRAHHIVYDYFRDSKRSSTNLPKECSLPKF